ncbi:MAG: hypothetical protein V3T83_18545 [Acidobacteriota bacterium]
MVENDPSLDSFSTASEALPPSRKFVLSEKGRDLSVQPTQRDEPSQPEPSPFISEWMRRPPQLFVGRRREMARVIDQLLPLPPGVRRGNSARRMVTLTKEGGIGKSALAAQVSSWARLRGCFGGGIYELGCEAIQSASELVARLLALWGVEAPQGDLTALLADLARQRFASSPPALLLLDNLDDLATGEQARHTRQLLDALLSAGENLHILATCRWETGLAHHEQHWKIALAGRRILSGLPLSLGRSCPPGSGQGFLARGGESSAQADPPFRPAPPVAAAAGAPDGPSWIELRPTGWGSRAEPDGGAQRSPGCR